METWTVANALERNGALTVANDPRALHLACNGQVRGEWTFRLYGGDGLPRENRLAWFRACIDSLTHELRQTRSFRREDEYAAKWAKDAWRRERAQRVARLLAERRALEKLLRSELERAARASGGC